jgi:hypothetical protein
MREDWAAGRVKVYNKERGVKNHEGDSALQGLLTYIKGMARYGSLYKSAIRKRCMAAVEQGMKILSY